MLAKTRRALIGGTVVAVLVGGAGLLATAGMASAHMMPMQRPGAGGANETMLTALAGKLGVTVEQLRAAMQEAHGANHPAGGPMGAHGMIDHQAARKAVAGVLGITEAEFASELKGKTLAEVVTAHGADLATVKAAVVTAVTAQIDAEIAPGRLAAERGATIKADLATRIDDLFTHRGQGMGGMRGGRNDDRPDDRNGRNDDRNGRGPGRRGQAPEVDTTS